MSAIHSLTELQRLYEKRFAGKSEYRKKFGSAGRRVLRAVDSGGCHCAGSGCGHCEFINNVRSEKRFGMDLNPDTIQQAAPGVQILAQSCRNPGHAGRFVGRRIHQQFLKSIHQT